MKPKKITKKEQVRKERIQKRKQLVEWSKSVRNRDVTCIVCGRTDRLNAHHILPKENYKEFMYEEINGITLCPIHHKFGKFSAHRHPIWFCIFLRNKRRKQYEWAKKNMGEE